MRHRDHNWRQRAACADIDGDAARLFFHDEGQSGASGYQQAKRICATCDVWQECLDFAMTTEYRHYRYGVFGGLTAKERHQLHVATR